MTQPAQIQTWFSKNKFVLLLIVGLGLFGLYAWKTNLSFVPYINKQNPAPYTPDTKDPPVVNPPVKTADEAAWRKQFEDDRK